MLFSSQVHFLRALVLQKAYSTPFVAVPPNLGRAIVVSDYCDAHRLDDNSVALSEAIVFAVEHSTFSVVVHFIVTVCVMLAYVLKLYFLHTYASGVAFPCRI